MASWASTTGTEHRQVGSRIRDNIERAVTMADVIRTGPFIDIARTEPVAVRTPADAVTRTVEQVNDEELRTALVLFVRDSGAVSEDDLITATARLFG